MRTSIIQKSLVQQKNNALQCLLITVIIFKEPFMVKKHIKIHFIFQVQKTSIIPLQFFILHIIPYSLQLNLHYLIRAEINLIHSMICNEQPFKSFDFFPGTDRIRDLFCLDEERSSFNLSCDMRCKLIHYNIIQCRV